MLRSKSFIISIGIICATALFFSACKKKNIATETLDLSSMTKESTTTSSGASETLSSNENKETAKSNSSTASSEASKITKPGITYEASNLTDNNFTSSYPIIKNSNNDEKVNNLILKNLNSIKDNLSDYENIKLEHEIFNASARRFSIVYKGTAKKSGDTINLFYTNNIDLQNAKDISLAELTDTYALSNYILSDEVSSVYKSSGAEDFNIAKMDYTLRDYEDMLYFADFPLTTDTSGKVSAFPSSFSYENDGAIFFSIPSKDSKNYYIIKYIPDTK